MNKNKHTKVKYVLGRPQACQEVNNRTFRRLVSLPNNLYEIQHAKAKIVHDIPSYLAFFVLNAAKLHLLRYHYDFVATYLQRNCWETCYVDTDSHYIACSAGSLGEIVKPEMKEALNDMLNNECKHREEFEAPHFLPRTCCTAHATFDSKTPGVFHTEVTGSKFIGLCSKSYVVQTCDNSIKYSAKGCQKRHIQNVLDIFENVLQNSVAHGVTNKGFRVHKNSVKTYEQRKRGFTPFYCKRVVQEDLIHTKPLPIVIRPYWRETIEDEQ